MGKFRERADAVVDSWSTTTKAAIFVIAGVVSYSIGFVIASTWMR